MPREALGNVLFSCNLVPPYAVIRHRGFWRGIGWPEMRIGQVSVTSSWLEKGISISLLHACSQYAPKQEGVKKKNLWKKVLLLLNAWAKGIYSKKILFKMASSNEWQLMVWASRNSHCCVGTSLIVCIRACGRVWTCVLWLVEVIHLCFKNMLRYLYFMKQRPLESLLCHCWLASECP